MSVATLAVRGISHSFGAHTVLDGVSFTLGTAQRMGVVGPNGAGKSTLLRIIANLIAPDSGSVVKNPATARVGYLAQEHERDAGETVLGHLGTANRVAAASAALDRASDELADAKPGADDVYSAALDTYLALGAADFDARVGEVLADIGLDGNVISQRTDALSGGQMARIGLAALLLSGLALLTARGTNCLVLDEPTNHLDLEAIEQLEVALESFDGTVILITHDRSFLETARVTRTMPLPL